MAVAAASNALTTVTAVRDFVGSGPATDLLQRYINAASATIENYLGRSLKRTVITDSAPEALPGSGDVWLRLAHYPIESITVIRENDEELDEDEYSIAEAGVKGRVYREDKWPRCVGVTDLITLLPDNRSPVNTIEVEYVGGYLLPGQSAPDPDTAIRLPADIEQACIDEVVGRITRPSAHISEETTPGGWRRKFTDTSKVTTSGRLLASTEAVLAPYRSPKAWGV